MVVTVVMVRRAAAQQAGHGHRGKHALRPAMMVSVTTVVMVVIVVVVVVVVVVPVMALQLVLDLVGDNCARGGAEKRLEFAALADLVA